MDYRVVGWEGISEGQHSSQYLILSDSRGPMLRGELEDVVPAPFKQQVLRLCVGDIFINTSLLAGLRHSIATGNRPSD